MLFLAVFCGFFAEYQLEHKIEKERSENLMRDVRENLKYDTTRMGRNVPGNSVLKKDLDSLRFEINNAIRGNVNSNRLYYFYLRSREFNSSTFNKAAITQLKNSGLLRLVKNRDLMNDMLDYYERIVSGSEGYNQETFSSLNVMNAACDHVFKTTGFDFIKNASDSAWNSTTADSYLANLDAVLNMKELELLSKNPADLEKLHSAVLRFEWSIINYNRFLNFARQVAHKLIISIDKQY